MTKRDQQKPLKVNLVQYRCGPALLLNLHAAQVECRFLLTPARFYLTYETAVTFRGTGEKTLRLHIYSQVE